MSTTCTLSAFKQATNHANLISNTNGFCKNLNQSVAASLSDRQRLTEAHRSMSMLGKAVPFIFSSTLPLEVSIREKFKHFNNSSFLSDDLDCDREMLECFTRGDLAVPNVPLGLSNPRFYCFQHATLQALLVTGPLLKFIMEKHNPTKCPLTEKEKFCSLCGIYKLVKMHKNSTTSSYKVITPSYFRSNLNEIGAFNHSHQEDAQEYFSGLLGHLIWCLKRSRPSTDETDTIVEKMFFGLTLNFSTCVSCKDPNFDKQPFQTLQLPVNSFSSVQRILANRLDPEIVEHNCSLCGAKKAEHREFILKAPLILTLQCLRFNRECNKLDPYIRYPLTFDLRPYMASTSGNSLNYQLYAMIMHYGSLSDWGHYVAFTNRGGIWYRISDDDIRQVEVAEVLAQKPYLLFYKLINPETVICSPEDPSVGVDCLLNRYYNQHSNSSVSQKFGSPRHSSNSVAQFLPSASQPALHKFDLSAPLLKKSTSTLPYVGLSSLKRSNSASMIPSKTQRFGLFDSERRNKGRSWSEKRFRDKRNPHGLLHHNRHSHKHKEKRRHY